MVTVMFDKGLDPVAERRRKKAQGITVREALEAHVRSLRKKGGSPRSEEDLRYCIEHYLGDWAGRALMSITREECRARHHRISEENGPYVANRTLRCLRAIWHSAAKVHQEIPRDAPTIGCEWNKQRRRRQPLRWATLPAWRARIEALGELRRDYLLFVALTGLRSEDAATVRYADADFESGTLHRPRPKGGEDRAFTIPIAEAALEIIRRRREANGTADYVFATKDLKGNVTPIVERRWGKKGESPHRLRDTFITAALQVGIPLYEVKVLVNHRLPDGGDTTLGYSNPELEHLRAQVERVAAFLLGKMTTSANVGQA